MSDDIVKRLRDYSSGLDYCDTCSMDPGMIFDAADEIEQLRKERDEARAKVEWLRGELEWTRKKLAVADAARCARFSRAAFADEEKP